MSIYKRPGALTYSFDFSAGGIRFSGDTGKTRERKALQEQERLKRLEKNRLESGKGKVGANLTFGGAAARYMEEVGRHQVNALTTLSNLEWLQQHIGKNTLISAIGENLVAQLVARRRQDFRKVGRAENRTKKVGNATVNRTCTEPLRKVLIRANSKWDCHVQKIDWSSHMLTEPKERIREVSPSEEAAIMDQL